MSSSGSSIFGNFSSIPAKSPKSQKDTVIENPLMKNVNFSYGGPTLTTQRASSALQTMPRSPLIAVTPNRDNFEHQQRKAKASQIATPGPPPKMSLSLMSGMAMPMQTKPAILKEPETKKQEQRFDTLKMPAGVSTPVPVASPPILEKKSTTDSYMKESSLTFPSEEHWVVAHGYTSSKEYEELIRILSTYGAIQSRKAGGNWVAVQYESRMSAEKALCCQHILLGNTLYGMTRGTPSLLQKLSSGKGEKQRQDSMQGNAKEVESTRIDEGIAPRSTGNLKEHDILLLKNSAYESRKPYKPKSVCDKILAWYFGWDEHPHSD